MNTLSQSLQSRQEVVLGRRRRASIRRERLRADHHQRIQNFILGAFVMLFVLGMALVFATAHKAYGDIKQGKEVPFPIPLTYLVDNQTGK